MSLRSLRAPRPTRLALAAARRPTARVAALVDAALFAGPLQEGARACVVVELAGDAAAVEQDAAGARERRSARPRADERARSRRCARRRAPGRSACASRRCRAVSPPRRTRCARGGGAVLAYPARGLVWARFALDGPGDERSAARALRAANEAARLAHGACLLEAAPVAAREGRDVFGGTERTLALERAVKRQYDPAGVLNPGRFAGGL